MWTRDLIPSLLFHYSLVSIRFLWMTENNLILVLSVKLQHFNVISLSSNNTYERSSTRILIKQQTLMEWWYFVCYVIMADNFDIWIPFIFFISGIVWKILIHRSSFVQFIVSIYIIIKHLSRYFCGQCIIKKDLS